MPRAAYVHVPFCRHRCGYCSFTLVAGRDDLVPDYLAAVGRELSWLEKPYEIDSLYFGGGTPTHLTPDQLRRLLTETCRWLRPAANAEISMEANPLDLSVEVCRVLSEAGVNRLSIGVQSFAAEKLALLERDHRRAEIEPAAELAARFFPAWSLDLIFGTPGESIAQWHEDLQLAMRLAPPHLSIYGLTWERGTRFWSRLQNGGLTACSDELEREMYELAMDQLTAGGFEQYEVSNFARRGFRCRHNEVYWTGRTFFGAGPGAARLVHGRREVNHRSTVTYLRRVLRGESPTAEAEELSPADSARERLVFGLRRLEGVDAAQFLVETGHEVRELGGAALTQFVEQGWLQWSGPRLRLTRSGLLISDALWPAFLSS